MSVKVKICGLTNIEDTMDAIELGADYLGFNFYKDSPRFLKDQEFEKIILEIPFEIPKVGVFVNADPQRVIDLVTAFDINFLQFHGDETAEYCNQFARPYIRAFRPESEKDLEGIGDYHSEFFLVDSFVQDSYGGTGVVSNWDLARKVKKEHRQPLFLAGGLKTENVEMAIHSVKPFAVDVSSGVEEKVRKKSYRKMEEFIKTAKSIQI